MAQLRAFRFGRTSLVVLMLAAAVTGCFKRDADLDVSTREIVLDPSQNTATFTVKNGAKDLWVTAGVTVLDYDVLVDRTWLTVLPASGRCDGGQQNTHTIQIVASLLAPGQNIAVISFRSNGGDEPITVRVSNDGGTPCTTPPTAPTSPAPGAGATEVPIGADLMWSGGASQCPGLTATYDVYFGLSASPPFHHDNGSAKTWDPGTLANATTYYWQIVAKDANGSTPGPVWSFTTSAAACTAAPGPVALVAPNNGATGVPIGADLSWSGGASQCPGLTAMYDVHFGTSATPPFHHDNGSAKTWDPGTLANATTYYWQIVAKDANGSTPGAVWSFTTVAAAPCDSLPTAACTPTPTHERTDVNENANLAWGCGDSQCSGLAATYDVYFGTNPAPGASEFLGNAAAKAWNLPPLLKNTTYYWQVVTKDANGAVPGPIWRFTTRR